MRFAAIAPDEFGELFAVVLVEGCVDFVEDVEACGLVFLDGEEKGEGGHGFFAAAEASDVEEFVAGYFDVDAQAAVEGVFFVVHDEVGLAFGGEFGEDALEFGVDGVECFEEDVFFVRFDFVHKFEDVVFFAEEDVFLFHKPLVFFFDGVVDFEGAHVDVADV